MSSVFSAPSVVKFNSGDMLSGATVGECVVKHVDVFGYDNSTRWSHCLIAPVGHYG